MKHIKISGTNPNDVYVTSKIPEDSTTTDIVELATKDWMHSSYDLQITSIYPIGTIVSFAANSNPEGFILCNGAAINRTTYSKLFDIIGTLYGEGDGSTTFTLPNLTNKYIQGSNTSGNILNAGLPEIGGNIYMGYNGGGWPDASADSTSVGASNSYVRHTVIFKASTYSSIYGASTTVQPKSVTMRYFIKY